MVKDGTSSISARLRPLGFERYADYLASDHWQDLRRRYRESDLPQSCKCGAPANALHHKTYVRLGEELLTDLEALCHGCHRVAHGRRRIPRKRKPRGKFPRNVKVRHDPSIIGIPLGPRKTFILPD